MRCKTLFPINDKATLKQTKPNEKKREKGSGRFVSQLERGREGFLQPCELT